MSSNKVYQILWADDEIDLLKPHILFLKEKGYEVTPVLSGADAIEAVQTQNFDLIFLDENMPGDYGPGCPAAHQGAAPLPPRHHDHQERGGRADEPSHRR